MVKHLVISALVAIVYLCPRCAMAQNLVTNPSFENYNNCPIERGQILYLPHYDSFLTVTDWVNPLYNTSPDYFNACASSPLTSVPYNNTDGYQLPRTGNAYAGIQMFTGFPLRHQIDDWREYIETRLTSPLQAGHTYYVSYFVNLAYHSYTSYNIISVDKLGARFTIAPLDTVIDSTVRTYFFNGPPDIVTPPGLFITDTVNWVRVSGMYHAKGGEQWLTLGHFNDSLPINYLLLYSPVGNIDSIHSTCYMNIDDVCVMDMADAVIKDTLVYSPHFPMILSGPNLGGQYVWQNGDTTASITINQPGKYWRQTLGDCSYHVDTITVEKLPIGSCIWLPTAFTPNNDGRNDFFGPETHCHLDFTYYSFAVYNRWGQQIFQTDKPNEKWNGTFNSVAQDIGVYYYLLRYSFATRASGSVYTKINNTSFEIIKGEVTLLK